MPVSTSTFPESPPVPWRLRVRSLWRVPGLLGVMVMAVVDYLLLGKEARASIRGRAVWLQRACRRCLAVLGVKVRCSGDPQQGVLQAPNHVSYLDIIVLAAQAPTVFVAKAEVRSWMLFGWFAQRAGTLFLRREVRADLVKVGAQLAPVMAEGVNLVVFLEGTSTDGREVRPFRSSLLAPAVAGEWSVAPVCVSYRVPPPYDVSVAVAWWGTMPLAPHLVGLTGLPRVEAQLQLGEPRLAGGDRKELAKTLRSNVAAMLEASTVG